MKEQTEDQVADIELGGPDVQAEAAAAEASTTKVSNTKTEDSPTASASASNGAAEKDSSNNSSAKRAAGQTGTAEDKSLPPSKRTRVAPPGGAQRRLFGVLTKTLSKFQEETKKDTEAVSVF